MENKKQILIIAAALFLLVILAYFAFRDAPTSQTGLKPTGQAGGGVEKVFLPQKPPTAASISLPISGSSLQVNNFFKLQTSVDEQGREVVVLHKSQEFLLQYVYSGNLFEVVLPGPVERYRQTAEKTLLNTLAISRLDACKLQVRWRIAGAKTASFSADMPLSFCPGGLPLE